MVIYGPPSLPSAPWPLMLSSKIKFSVLVLLFAIIAVTSALVWYLNPGFDPIITGDIIESGRKDYGELANLWKVTKISKENDIREQLINYGYKIDHGIDSENIYAERTWLWKSRFRKVRLCHLNTDERLRDFNGHMESQGATLRGNKGDRFVVMWSGYYTDIESIVENVKYR